MIKRTSGGDDVPFEIDAFRKHCLVNGLDDIGLTLEKVGGGCWRVWWGVYSRVFKKMRSLCNYSLSSLSPSFLFLIGGCDLGVRSETKR